MTCGRSLELRGLRIGLRTATNCLELLHRSSPPALAFACLRIPPTIPHALDSTLLVMHDPTKYQMPQWRVYDLRPLSPRNATVVKSRAQAATCNFRPIFVDTLFGRLFGRSNVGALPGALQSRDHLVGGEAWPCIGHSALRPEAPAVQHMKDITRAHRAQNMGVRSVSAHRSTEARIEGPQVAQNHNLAGSQVTVQGHRQCTTPVPSATGILNGLGMDSKVNVQWCRISMSVTVAH